MAVDLSKYLSYIRYQGGDGCWGCATCAMWDILNELYCPNSPTISMNLWLMMHRRRDRWEQQGQMEMYMKSPDDRFHKIVRPAPNASTGPEFGFFQSFGITTEGTEPTVGSTRWTGDFTMEGINEAWNYRLKSLPVKIDISTQKFREELDQHHPIRLEAGGHVVAIVGYDEVQQTFKFVDSYGDRRHQGGFGKVTFAEVDNKKMNYLGDIHVAYTIEIIPPRPVPVARLWLKHSMTRMNLNLWLSVEGSPLPKRKIWPAWEWSSDTSETLHFNVRLPSEFIWPPSPVNRLVLDVYDSGSLGSDGGEIIEFNAAFGAHIVNCVEILNQGPITFNAGEHRRFYLPQ